MELGCILESAAAGDWQTMGCSRWLPGLYHSCIEGLARAITCSLQLCTTAYQQGRCGVLHSKDLLMSKAALMSTSTGNSNPSWLCCTGHMRLSFLRAAYYHDHESLSHSFSCILAQQSCPFCNCQRYLGIEQWEHLLQNCTGVKALAEE